MIRIKGFARKTRRSTKGGSLSASSGIRIFLENSILRRLSPEKLPRPVKHDPHCGNGDRPFGSNGAEEGVEYNEERLHQTASSSEDTRASVPINVAQYMQNALADLVSSEGEARSVSGASPTDQAHGSDLQPRSPRGPVEVPEVANFAMPRWKRIFDLLCILLTSPCWLPLTCLVMFWIRVTSRGPVFYRQERVGYRRSRFMIFKFRTMHVNAETRTHEDYIAHLMRVDCPMTKLDDANDSRLVRCGRFLRASGLDELPQIFNVIRGDMSLVGPRPCLPSEFERYQKWQQERVNAPPGMTGYWQVNGKNKTTFSEMIAMDLFYANNMSIRLDLSIMLKTIPALILQTLESRGQNGSLAAHAAAETLSGSVRKI